MIFPPVNTTIWIENKGDDFNKVITLPKMAGCPLCSRSFKDYNKIPQWDGTLDKAASFHITTFSWGEGCGSFLQTEND